MASRHLSDQTAVPLAGGLAKMPGVKLDRAEKKAQKMLGPLAGSFLPLAEELSVLIKTRPALAQTYSDGAKSFISEIGGAAYDTHAKLLETGLTRAARKAVYSDLGIELKDSYRAKKDLGQSIDSASLFEIASIGQLREHILDIARLRAGLIMLEKLYGTKVYRATIEPQGKRVYLKEECLEPDMLAAKMLSRAGMVVPEIRNIKHKTPDTGAIEYGLMNDIAEAQGVKRAVSLRSLGRDKKMTKWVEENFEEFSKKLGCAFEACRNLGIQDMHSRNLFLVEMSDGRIEIGMIDLGVVACYPPESEAPSAYGGQLSSIVGSLDFAFMRSKTPQKEPEGADNLFHQLGMDDSLPLKMSIFRRMAKPFIMGASDSYYLKPENKLFVKKEFKKHQGIQIGWATPFLGERKTLDWRHAWKEGFRRQHATDMEEFWQAVFSQAPFSEFTLCY